MPFLHPNVLAVILIAQMGSPSYYKRQQAMQALDQLAPLVVPYLKSGQQHPDVEVARRSEILLASYYEQAAAHFMTKAKPTKWPCLPWIDMLPKDYPDRALIVEYFLAQARDKVGRKGPPDWDDYRTATELYLHYLFVNQNSLDHAIQLLDQMAGQEEKWIAENGKNYSPPLKAPVASGQ
jgi:hypothetical protein